MDNSGRLRETVHSEGQNAVYYHGYDSETNER